MRFVMCYKWNYWLGNMGLVRRALTSTDGGVLIFPEPPQGWRGREVGPQGKSGFSLFVFVLLIYYFNMKYKGEKWSFLFI